GALAARPNHLELGVQSKQAGREVAEGVGMGGGAADGSPVSDLRVADLRCGAAQDRQPALDQVGKLDVVMCGQGAERDVTVLLPDVVEVLDPPDVDDERG